ncbi:unnamed protein product, partial [Discosporangium mesarthrocarpum]
PSHLSSLWIKPRELRIGNWCISMSLSEAAGHASFVFLGLMYAEADVLYLRLYATAGISCSILFQYFRPQPLWIPITWNFAFLGINSIMAIMLIKEADDSHRLGQEKEDIYHKVFQQSGLSTVDFMHLMDISEAVNVPPGQVIARNGVTQDKIYLVIGGSLRVEKEGTYIGSVREGEFAGEAS